MTEEDDDEGPDYIIIICAACKAVLGHGPQAEASMLAMLHIDECPATKEQYEQAVYDLKFRSMIQGMRDD